MEFLLHRFALSSIHIHFTELNFVNCDRAFVEKNYKELKKANPKLPILIRECSGTEPQLWARYGERIPFVLPQ